MKSDLNASEKLFSKKEGKKVMAKVISLLRGELKDELSTILDEMAEGHPLNYGFSEEIDEIIRESLGTDKQEANFYLGSKICEGNDFTVLEIACKLYCKYQLGMRGVVDVTWAIEEYNKLAGGDIDISLSSVLDMLYVKSEYGIDVHVYASKEIYADNFSNLLLFYDRYSDNEIMMKVGEYPLYFIVRNLDFFNEIIKHVDNNEDILLKLINHARLDEILSLTGCNKDNFISLLLLLKDSDDVLEGLLEIENLSHIISYSFNGLEETNKKYYKKDPKFLVSLFKNGEIASILGHYSCDEETLIYQKWQTFSEINSIDYGESIIDSVDNGTGFDKDLIPGEKLNQPSKNLLASNDALLELLSNKKIAEKFEKLVYVLSDKQRRELCCSHSIIPILYLEEEYFVYLLEAVVDDEYKPNFKNESLVEEIKKKSHNKDSLSIGF